MRNCILLPLILTLATASASEPLNILFFTSDDMNHDSTAVCGGPIKDLTPNVDRFASQGLLFRHAYSTVAVCQPVRQIMQTGLYPHRNGCMGFYPIKPHVQTLNAQLHKAGYLISMFGKMSHHRPIEKFHVDVGDDKISRHPSKLAEATRKFLRRARKEGRPFFHNVNCYDPHRPFIGMKGPDDLALGEAPSRWVKPEEITEVPGFLEDLPDIRRELAGYYTNVRRMDDALGAVLKVLEEEGFADNTLVMFYGGDHGMSFPFAKSNNYVTSSRAPLIIRWPGVTRAGSEDSQHLISTIDFTPTLLDAAKLPPIPDLDGRSFLPIVKGAKLDGWDHVFTFYNAAFGNKWYPMRTIRTRDLAYTWNAWSDGKTRYRTENMAGLTWKAMQAAAEFNPKIKSRTQLNSYRVPEEFFDLTKDPYERNNLINKPDRQTTIENMRGSLLKLMKDTKDPLAEAFANRENRELTERAIEQLKKDYNKSHRK